MTSAAVKLTVQLKKDATAEFEVWVTRDNDDFVVQLQLLDAEVRDPSLTTALELMASKIKQHSAASYF